MSIWTAILANPEPVLDILTAGLALLGVGKWRKSAKASTVAQVDRWASTAAGAVVLLVRAGIVDSEADAVVRFVEKLRQLARAAGVQVSPEHEHRALAILHTVLVAVGPDLAAAEMAKVARVIQAAGDRMAQLPWPKDAP